MTPPVRVGHAPAALDMAGTGPYAQISGYLLRRLRGPTPAGFTEPRGGEPTPRTTVRARLGSGGDAPTLAGD